MLKKKIWLGICVFLLVLLALAVWVYRAAVMGPDYYRQSLVIEENEARRLGEELEDRYLSAHNRMVRESTWSLAVSDAQLNGWIASTLKEKYPRFQPTQIDNIRTSLEGDRIRIAFRVKDAIVPIVICVELQPYVTADDQNIAFRLDQVCTGVLPLPKKQASEQITNALTKMKIPIVWSVENGVPLGLIPSSFEMKNGIERKWQIKSIKIEEGQMIINGTATDS